MKNQNIIKSLVAALILLAGFATSNTVSAQASASGTANLSVVLSELRSITVGTPNVSVPITTAAHYQTGNFTDVANHVTITSSQAYKITATSATANLVNGVNSIPANTITLTPTAGTVNGGGTVTYNAQPLVTATPGNLIAGTAGTTSSSFNIKYTASGGSSYLVPAGTYTTTVTYTVAAP
jgi:hypothetical protein